MDIDIFQLNILDYIYRQHFMTLISKDKVRSV